MGTAINRNRFILLRATRHGCVSVTRTPSMCLKRDLKFTAKTQDIPGYSGTIREKSIRAKLMNVTSSSTTSASYSARCQLTRNSLDFTPPCPSMSAWEHARFWSSTRRQRTSLGTRKAASTSAVHHRPDCRDRRRRRLEQSKRAAERLVAGRHGR
jgi:hypothetical protein